MRVSGVDLEPATLFPGFISSRIYRAINLAFSKTLLVELVARRGTKTLAARKICFPSIEILLSLAEPADSRFIASDALIFRGLVDKRASALPWPGHYIFFRPFYFLGHRRNYSYEK